ncbi:FAD-binding oxidoreductase [Tumidithrix elongata RA019]|uniref:FAD-binding oxidoreductase n=2 Tax=Tumidithrix TaxID=3088355 RepID=A0AAW9PW23_9CYAN|nr:FAD-binding oxidoreductase [Tumidithrix elongata RA019]
MDRFWLSYRETVHSSKQNPSVISESDTLLVENDFDVAIAGGTLGIFIGCALQLRGWRVLVIEQGILKGREQEWNISRPELEAFLALDLLTSHELEQAIATEYNPGRVGFHQGIELWVRDVLNIGVDPVFLLATLKAKFLAHGGILLENMGFQQAIAHPNGIEIEVAHKSNGEKLKITARLLLDAMGHFSAIARQARIENRQRTKPEGVCMVVGSCAQGIPAKAYGDLIYTFAPIQNQCQYFWEAFPAKEGRTTYLFTYVDADLARPSFSQLFADYLHWLPQYQDVELEALKFKRTLFGFFPSYQQTPLQTAWHRILQVGDSSGSQSPLSFGGFGAMVRHLTRLTNGIDAALSGNFLSRNDLRSLQPYQPSLSVTWLFQKTMSVGINQKIEGNAINYLLSTVFASMQKLGDPVLKPFLQDVVQFPALSQTMLSMAIADPVLVTKIVTQVGIPPLLDWMQHYMNLGRYSLLDRLGKSLEPTFENLLPEQRYYWQRWYDQWKYGSGGDYHS